MTSLRLPLLPMFESTDQLMLLRSMLLRAGRVFLPRDLAVPEVCRLAVPCAAFPFAGEVFCVLDLAGTDLPFPFAGEAAAVVLPVAALVPLPLAVERPFALPTFVLPLAGVEPLPLAVLIALRRSSLFIVR